MRKILSLIAGLGLVFSLAANVSAATPGIDVSQTKQGTELVVTVTADGTLGATVLDLEFDTDELSCTVDDIVMPANTDNIAYACDVSDGVVSIGFVALDAKHAPKGTIATITFEIAKGAQNKTAEQFNIGVEQVDVVTLDELKKLTGQETGSSSNNSGNGSSQGGQSGTESDVVTLDKDVISDIVENIETQLEQATGEGAATIVIEVDMTKDNGEVATEVPVEILEVIQGQNVEVTFDMGAYSWTINGKDVDAEKLEAINLEVVLDADAIDESIVEAIANGETTYQISLTHEGDFGFTATLTLNVGKEYSGFKGALYYFDGNKPVYQSTKEVDENGNVSYEFSHASDYVIVLSENDDVEEDDKQPADDENQEEKPPVDDTDDTDDKKTPWGLVIGLVAVVVVVAAAGVFMYMKRK